MPNKRNLNHQTLKVIPISKIKFSRNIETTTTLESIGTDGFQSLNAPNGK